MNRNYVEIPSKYWETELKTLPAFVVATSLPLQTGKFYIVRASFRFILVTGINQYDNIRGRIVVLATA
jgi:hypothetical protein